MTRNGEPVGLLTPLRRRAFVARAEIVHAAERMPRIDATRFREDLDAVVDQDIFSDTDENREP